MTASLVIFGLATLLAGGVLIELLAVLRAPVGWQDERGFHHGVPSAAVQRLPARPSLRR